MISDPTLTTAYEESGIQISRILEMVHRSLLGDIRSRQSSGNLPSL